LNSSPPRIRVYRNNGRRKGQVLGRQELRR
jgi:hypothetical protein